MTDRSPERFTKVGVLEAVPAQARKDLLKKAGEMFAKQWPGRQQIEGGHHQALVDGEFLSPHRPPARLDYRASLFFALPFILPIRSRWRVWRIFPQRGAPAIPVQLLSKWLTCPLGREEEACFSVRVVFSAALLLHATDNCGPSRGAEAGR
jgi:hypothetical protein